MAGNSAIVHLSGSLSKRTLKNGTGKKTAPSKRVLAASVKNRREQPTLVLASAAQEEGLKSIADAMRHGIVRPVLIGDARQVSQMAKKLKVPLKGMELIDEAIVAQPRKRRSNYAASVRRAF